MRVYAPTQTAGLAGLGEFSIVPMGVQQFGFTLFNTRRGFSEALLGPREAGPRSLKNMDLTVDVALNEEVLEMTEQYPEIALLGIESKTGAVRIAVSTPSFSPARMSDPAYVDEIMNTEGSLTQRAFTGQYQPGSVVKPLEVAKMLSDGFTLPPVPCDPAICNGHYHGPAVTPLICLEKSCNTATKRWVEDSYTMPAWVRSMRDIGFQRDLHLQDVFGDCGARLPDESIPWKSRLAVGHGFTTTPLALATCYLALQSDGRPVQPYLIERINGRSMRPRYDRHPVFTKRAVQTVIRGMRLCATKGTGKRISRTYRGQVFCKTGTANRASGPSDAIFVAFSKDYLVVICVPHGGGGSRLATLAGRILTLLERNAR